MGISKSDQVLIDAANDLGNVYQDVTTTLSTMRSELEELRRQWQGGGGTAFQNAIDAWDAGAKKTLKHMEIFAQQLQDTEKTYSVTEDTVQSTFNKYAGGLG